MERLKWVPFYRLQEKWWFCCFTFPSILRSGHWVDGPHVGCFDHCLARYLVLSSRSMILHSTNCFSSHFRFSLFSPAIHIHIHIHVPTYFDTYEKNNFEVNRCRCGRLLDTPASATVRHCWLSTGLPYTRSTTSVQFHLSMQIFSKGSHPVSFRSFSCRLRYIVHDDNGLRVLLSASVRGIIILSTKSYYAYVFAREV